MQPLGAGQHADPVDRAEIGPGKSRVRPIVENVRRPLNGARRQEVQPHSPGPCRDIRYIDTPTPQLIGGCRAQTVVRHDRNHLRRVAEARQTDQDIGLGAADAQRQGRQRIQQMTARRGQTYQQLAETNNVRLRHTCAPCGQPLLTASTARVDIKRAPE